MEIANVLQGAATWVVGLLLGGLAVSLATIAVALLGVGLMAGRLSVRRAGHIAVGMMLIFGANVVAHGLIGSVGFSTKTVDVSQISPPPIEVRKPSAQVYDPYAGASVPTTRSSADAVVFPR